MSAPTEHPLEPKPAHAPPSGSFVQNVLPAIIWTLLLFLGGGGPPPAQQSGDIMGLPIDKLLHAGAFVVLSGLVFRALHFEMPDLRRRPLALLAASIAASVGVILEVYQLALPDRSASVGDAVADAVGAVAGALLLGFRGTRR